MRRRTSPELLMTAALVLSAFGCQRAIPAPVPKPTTAEHLKHLAEAGEILQKRAAANDRGNDAEVEKLSAQFAATVKQLAPNLAAVTPEATATPKAYSKLMLNTGKAKFDAFRFRVPDGKANANLDWEFVYAKRAGLDSWYIEPVDGKLKGFESFRPSEDWQEDFAELPAQNHRVVQDLPGGRLVPGAEYVIWFTFTDEKPVELFVRLGLTPVK